MKTKFKYYVVCWAIMFALFNLVVFITPNEWYGFNKFGGAFWPSYLFMVIAFVGHLFCSMLAFRTENLKKFFYNVQLVSISYYGLIAMLIVGGICFAIPNLSNWIAVILCAAILAFTAVACVQAKAAADIVDEIDNKVKQKIFYIKSLTVDAESLMNSANGESKKQVKKAYEALRYSDPMSDDRLAEYEKKIEDTFNDIKEAVKADKTEELKQYVDVLISLVDERNKKCRLLK